jgi:gliding motility-associated-like protein
MKIFLLTLTLTLSCLLSSAQNIPNRVSYYSFDTCIPTDQESTFNNAQFSGNPECVCGPGSDAFSFDGIDDFAVFEQDINTIFEDDFSISFYFRIGTSTEPVDIISFRPTCTRDSSFSIRYIPAINELSVEFSENVGERAVTKSTLNTDNCWHWVVYTRSTTEYKLFLDGVKVDEADSDRQLMLNDTVRLSIANSPCVGISDVRFDGILDELKIFNRTIDESEIPLLDQRFDKIISNDTTIFLGDAIPIQVGQSCSNSFTWTPTQGLTNATDLEPLASPTNSTTYTIRFNYSDCSTSDDILINVIDSSNLDCENLLLPAAFTPNGDGLNDDFGISNSFIIDDLSEFKILGRWGDTVFSTTNKNSTWDGTFNGGRMRPGTMVYQVKYTCGNNEYIKVGSFSIIR